MKRLVISGILFAMTVSGSALAEEGAAEPLDVLVFTKTSGFQHSVTKWDENGVSLVDETFRSLAEQNNWRITASKDGGMISTSRLQDFDVVVFYTSGDLTEEGTDGFPPMSETGVDELIEWIENGGGFVATHSASDTFRETDGIVHPYIECLGGEFAGHGPQFRGTVRVTSEDHPAMQSVPQGWTIHEEWYVHTNINEPVLHVCAVLEPNRMRSNNEMYEGPDMPIKWVRTLGEGRIFYTAMGHREDVWTNDVFQANLVDAVHWVSGQGVTDAAPNFDEAVPKTVEESYKRAVGRIGQRQAEKLQDEAGE